MEDHALGAPDKSTAAPNLDALVAALRTAPAGAPLKFATADGPVGAGYHITELRLAQITGIDCGGRVAEWQEVDLELLDGAGDAPMAVGKSLAILERSAEALSGIGTPALHVAFGHGNQSLTRYGVEEVELSASSALIRLGTKRAMCKPAEAQKSAGQSSCCG